MLKPVGPHDCAEHDDDEQQARDVHGRHQLAERQQRAEPVHADREGHRAERADRSEPHHQADDREQAVGERLEQRDQRCAPRLQVQHRQPEQHREQQHLQDVAAGKRTDDAVGNDVQEELGDAGMGSARRVGGDAFGIERRRVHVHARTRLHDRDDDQSDDQRERGDHFEVQRGRGTRHARRPSSRPSGRSRPRPS